MFLTQTELLPEDETIEEHAEGRRQEAAIIATDKAGPGLFKGVFGKGRRYGVHLDAIRDAADGVERCPLCTWELEDGECLHCGYGVADSLAYDSDEDDRDVSPLDDFEGPFGGLHRPQLYGIPARERPYVWHDYGADHNEGDPAEYMSPVPFSEESGDSSEDEEDDDEDMSSFISNDEDHDLPDAVNEDDESVQTVHGYPNSETADTDAEEINTSPPRQFYPIDLSSSSDSSNDDSDDSSDDQTTTTNATQATHDGEVPDDVSDQATNYDTDSSVREISPPILPRYTRPAVRRRRTIPDEDSEVSSSQASDETATQPPQVNTARLQHLRGQRQRRAHAAYIPHNPRGRVTISLTSDTPPRQIRSPPVGHGSRRAGRGEGTEANSIPARRGRPAMARVY